MDGNPVRVGINGFGRIGRLVFRAMQQHGGFQVVAVNDLYPAGTLAHLLANDSVHVRFSGVTHDGDAILMHGGEALAARDRFADLDRVTQEALLAFLGTL